MITGLVLLYIFLLLFFYKKDKKNFRPLTIFGYTILAYTLFLFCMIEVLSLFHLITSISVIICWLLFDGFLLYKIISFRNNNKIVTSKFIKSAREFFKDNKIYIFISIIFAFIVLVISALIVPFNWDSLSYHLTRLVVWLEQGSVEHFSTIDTRMLGTPPLKEFLDLSVYAIIGHSYDSILNLTQTFSYLFNILLVVEIASLIGCKKRGKILAALLFASSPICIGEAFTTQTDQFAALFVLIFIIMCLSLIKNPKLINLEKDSFFKMIAIGLCVAFTYLAKPSGVFGILVFTLYVFIICIKNKIKFKTMIIWALTAVCVALIVLFPELLRNYLTYGSLMDPWQGPGQLVLTLDPRYFTLNMLKNYGMNLIDFPFPFLADNYINMINSVAKVFGINPSNSMIAEGGMKYHIITNSRFSCDTAGNYLIFLILPIIILIFIIRSISKRKLDCPYGIAALITFFMALCFVKWEPYMARYLVAYVGVIAPFIAYELENISNNKFISNCSYVLVILGCSFLLIVGLKDYVKKTYVVSRNNYENRNHAYYVGNPGEYYTTYKPLSEKLGDSHYKKIGFDMYSSGGFNYPIYRLLLEHADDVNIIHSRNATVKYEEKNYKPNIIVETCFNTRCPKDFDNYKYQKKEYNNIEKITDNVWIINK